MTRTTAELEPPSLNFRAAQAGGRLAHDGRFGKHTRRIFDGIGFERGTVRPRSRNLTTRPLWPYFLICEVYKQPDATSSSDSDPDLSPTPRPQIDGHLPSRGSIPRILNSPPTNF
ncbi:hypothetical protein AVEN_178468-1 [Araneus ventricosus]|uniref:Uncharacterized protein n=1 Tax=Araneus ventricosus TaxID=182803 RepID=A0A4Y2CE52_ARAVE|nr:hypothetical protein AVEN_178468-1 [Araneus ventricosus]